MSSSACNVARRVLLALTHCAQGDAFGGVCGAVLSGWQVHCEWVGRRLHPRVELGDGSRAFAERGTRATHARHVAAIPPHLCGVQDEERPSRRRYAAHRWAHHPITKRVCVTDADGVAKHWHITSGKCLHTVEAAEDNQLFAVDYRADGDLFATAGSDKEVRPTLDA